MSDSPVYPLRKTKHGSPQLLGTVGEPTNPEARTRYHQVVGDGVRHDEDGYCWIIGRVDEVTEAAVVGYPHDITGQGVYAYVTSINGAEATDNLKRDLISLVRSEISPIAKVNIVQSVPGLPKAHSGKIKRRILRKIAANEVDSLGYTSTLAAPSVVESLIENCLNR